MARAILIRRASQSLHAWRAAARTDIQPRAKTRMSLSTSASLLPLLNGMNGLSKPASSMESITTNEQGSMAPQRAQSAPQTFHSAPSPQKRFAVLVDAENASLDSMKLVLNEIQEQLGAETIVRRVYGDFSRDNSHKMQVWQEFCLRHAFMPVHAFSYVQGKNSTDTALIIDAMELLFTNENINGFCIVSSDSDFTRLTMRLREAGKCVIGFGHENSTAEPFIAACEQFIFVNDLVQQEEDRLEQEALAEAQAEETSRLARRQEEDAAAAQLKAEEEENAEERRKAQEGSLQRLISTISDLFNGSAAKENGSNKTADNDTADVQSVLPTHYETVSREDLDRLHAKCEQRCNAQGHVRLDLMNQGQDSQSKLVDYRQYGYERLLLLILDHPTEFEIVDEDANPPVIRSLKNKDIHQVESENDEGGDKGITVLTEPELNRLHNVVNSCTDENGWALLSRVASMSELQITNLGYTKFSKLVKDMPTEFEFKMRGAASQIKSMRN